MNASHRAVGRRCAPGRSGVGSSTGVQRDRRRRAAASRWNGDQRGQVEVGEHVAVADHERSRREPTRGERDRAAGAQRLRLDHVRSSPARSPKWLADRVGQVAAGEMITGRRRGARRCATWCSRNGRFAIGSIGLGRVSVSGRRRVPAPPTRTTAITSGDVGVDRGRGRRRDRRPADRLVGEPGRARLRRVEQVAPVDDRAAFASRRAPRGEATGGLAPLGDDARPRRPRSPPPASTRPAPRRASSGRAFAIATGS